MQFALMTSEQLAAYINTKLSAEPVFKAAHAGPRDAIYAVDSTDLPEKMTRLINQIMASESVFDVPSAESNTTLAPHTPGKMRSYHGNIDKWLPVADATAATTKSRKYADYIAEFKGQPNNLKGKAGGDTGQTGYIEYTGAGWSQGVQHGRLVYNYYEDKMFFCLHYQPGTWAKTTNPFLFVNWRIGLGKSDNLGTTALIQASPWAL